jgi:hypothetical protein
MAIFGAAVSQVRLYSFSKDHSACWLLKRVLALLSLDLYVQAGSSTSSPIIYPGEQQDHLRCAVIQ